jgi:hypothetical protein
VRERRPVPVADHMAAAVKLAGAVAVQRPRKATAGTFRRPDPKPSTGLAPAPAARIGGTG